MACRISRLETRPTVQLLTELEEKVIVHHILDMDERGFASRLAGVEDMANYSLETRGGDALGSCGHIDLYNAVQKLRRISIAFTTFRALCVKIPSL